MHLCVFQQVMLKVNDVKKQRIVLLLVLLQANFNTRDYEETILELLTAKFPGMRKDGLNNLAMSLSLVCSDKESAEKLVGDLTAEKVEESIKDYRTIADQETAKAIETYKKSHPEPQVQTQEPHKPSAPEGMTAEAITKRKSPKDRSPRSERM